MISGQPLDERGGEDAEHDKGHAGSDGVGLGASDSTDTVPAGATAANARAQADQQTSDGHDRERAARGVKLRRARLVYADAQRSCLESTAPYARRLFHQMGMVQVDEIEGLPSAMALQPQPRPRPAPAECTATRADEMRLQPYTDAVTDVGQDVLLEREGKTIALEISITTGTEHEAQNLEKCLGAGFDQVIAVGNNARKLARLQKLMRDRLPVEQFQRLTFDTTESVVARLANTPVAPASTKKKKVRGYEVTANESSGKNATGNPEQVVNDTVAKALQRFKKNKRKDSDGSA